MSAASAAAILATVIGIASEQLCMAAENISAASLLQEDLLADSLDQIELVMALEDEFGIEVPDDDMEAIKTVGDIVAYVEKKLSEKAAAK